MRTSDHFKIPREDRLDYWNYKPCPEELIKRPMTSPIYEVKNHNKLINSAMLYFSKPSHRDHGFYPDPRIPYESYFAEETEKREKLRFGENRTITFDINEEVDKMLIKESELKQPPWNRVKSSKNIRAKPILKPDSRTVVPYESHPKPYLDACQEIMIKCYNMCSIPLEYLDVDKMFDSLMKLMFGISNEFKMKELCFNYLLAAERRKWFEESEGLNTTLEQSENEKIEMTRQNAEMAEKLQQESAKVETLQKLFGKLKQVDKVQEENTGLTLVNADLTSQKEQLNSKLAKSEKRIAQLDAIQSKNAEFQERISELTIKNKNLSDDYDKNVVEKQELQLKNSQLFSKNSELESENRSVVELRQELSKTNANLKLQVEERNTKIKSLETHTETIKKKYDRDFKSDLKYFKNKINDMLKENVYQTSELEKAKANLNQANNKIGGLLEDNATLQKDNGHMNEDLQQKLKDVRDLQLQLKYDKETFAKYERLDDEKKACDKTIMDLRKDCKILQENFQILQDLHSKLTTQNYELNKYRKAAHDALYELNEEFAKIEDLNSILQEDHKNDQTKIDELNDRLKDSLKTIETVKRKHQQLENKLQALQCKYHLLEKQFKAREFEIQQARNNMRQMTSTLYHARMDAYDDENVLPVTNNKDLTFKSTKAPTRKRDLLRSLANRRAVMLAEPSQSLNKNIY